MAAPDDDVFVSEAIEPLAGSFDVAAMSRGEPGLPRSFTWRGRQYDVDSVVTAYKTSASERGEMYLRRHWYQVRTATGERMNLLLVDGRKLFREGLSVLLEKHADLAVVGEADDAAAAPKLVKALAPHVAKAIESIIAARAGTRVIVLTFQADASFAREVLQAGASACLTKESASSELVTAIRTVMARQTYLSPTIADAVVAGYVLPQGKRAAPRALSSREREILQRIADGQTTKAIASALGVGAKTIETYRRRMMEKLGLHSVAELTKYAVREGLTSLDTRR